MTRQRLLDKAVVVHEALEGNRGHRTPMRFTYVTYAAIGKTDHQSIPCEKRKGVYVAFVTRTEH